MGMVAMVICKSPSLHVPSVKDLSLLDPIGYSKLKIPFALDKGDIPDVLLNADPNDPFVWLIMELAEADVNSWGSPGGATHKGHPFIWVVRSKAWDPPNGWNERVKEEGLVVYDWVEQRSILAHPSIGLVIPQRDVGGAKIMTVDRGVICERVKELMGGAKGRKVKERACYIE
nr:hypothetical protein CFP56_12447 [Quercus suber]